jgi:uncharacterized membrane protein
MKSIPNETPTSRSDGQSSGMDISPKPPRLLFLDMMRFIALVMMLQGHTVYVLLEHEIRDGGSTGISVWRFFRGYTAPVFMTVAGMVFTYLLVLAAVHSGDIMSRLRPGLLRVLSLLVWGYALRMPLDVLWSTVSQKKLDIGLAVDVLHLIGFGLLAIIIVFLMCRPLLRWGKGLVAGVFFLLFMACVQVTPHITGQSFHREAGPMISQEGLGVVVASNPKGEGIEVKEVLDGSRAEKLGLMDGDIITRIGEKEIPNREFLARAEASQTYGEPSPIGILRDGKEVEIDWVYERRARAFPNILTFWLNREPAPSGIASQFPIFPWSGYLMFGACLGVLLAEMNRRHTIPRRLDLVFLITAMGFMTWGELATGFDQVWLGGGECAIVFQRLGGVMLLAAAMFFLSHWIKRLPPLVMQMSRNSLWLYIGHLVLLYNIRPMIYREKFDVAGTLAGVVLIFALMIAQTLVIEKKRQLGSWKNMLGFLAGTARLEKSK